MFRPGEPGTAAAPSVEWKKRNAATAPQLPRPQRVLGESFNTGSAAAHQSGPRAASEASDGDLDRQEAGEKCADTRWPPIIPDGWACSPPESSVLQRHPARASRCLQREPLASLAMLSPSAQTAGHRNERNDVAIKLTISSGSSSPRQLSFKELPSWLRGNTVQTLSFKVYFPFFSPHFISLLFPPDSISLYPSFFISLLFPSTLPSSSPSFFLLFFLPSIAFSSFLCLSPYSPHCISLSFSPPYPPLFTFLPSNVPSENEMFVGGASSERPNKRRNSRRRIRGGDPGLRLSRASRAARKCTWPGALRAASAFARPPLCLTVHLSRNQHTFSTLPFACLPQGHTTMTSEDLPLRLYLCEAGTWGEIRGNLRLERPFVWEVLLMRGACVNNAYTSRREVGKVRLGGDA
ncbi:hypothetical protein C7M84_011401 [Penaeus vannamei]|uniref:Uncharacterized protein n=1 Tax=Penaeus vannamei TaxID=6689 RepID=A0A3R7SQ08_PENVA|nr:hypothetical protein C7M84_011401 [Penaeus vannamei]